MKDIIISSGLGFGMGVVLISLMGATPSKITLVLGFVGLIAAFVANITK